MDFIVEPTFTVMSDAIDAITSFLQLQLNNNGGTGSDKILSGKHHDSKHYSVLYIGQKNNQIVILTSQQKNNQINCYLIRMSYHTRCQSGF